MTIIVSAVLFIYANCGVDRNISKESGTVAVELPSKLAVHSMGDMNNTTCKP